MANDKLHSLTIEKLVSGGFGLGRLADGMVVLVRRVLPGETVLVRAGEAKKDYLYAELIEVLAPAPDRLEPACPIYDLCGGCDLQHAEPAAQLRLKKGMLVDTLQRAGSPFFEDGPLPVERVRPAPAPFNYRQRLRFQVDRRGRYGFYQVKSHEIVPVSRCLLAHEQLNDILLQLRRLSQFQELVRQCRAFELLYNPAGDATLLLLHFRRRPRPTDSSLAAEVKKRTIGLGPVLMQVEGHGLFDPLSRSFRAKPPILAHTVQPAPGQAELTFSWEAGGFCQVNLEQNRNLITLVLEMIDAGPHQSILDLYCGFGNFSLPAARLAATVLGIDAQNAAIRSGQENAALNRISNCRFEKNQVPAAVAALIAAARSFDTIILDPPRRGAPEVASLLPQLDPARIIYISCNPATLARDLASLTAAGYRVVRLVPVDMFPQTHHLESVALLERSGPEV